jgi:hypothetical protein
VFLSFSNSKRDFYLTPIAPAAALLSAATWEALWEWFREKLPYDSVLLQRVFFITGAVLAALAFTAGNPFVVNFPGRRFPDLPAFLLVTGSVFMLAALAKALLPRVSIAKAVLAAIVVLVMACQYLYLSYTVPQKNTSDSGASFYKALPALVKPEAPLAFFWKYENYALSFYSRRPIIYLQTEDAVHSYMSAREKRYLVLAEKFLKNFPNMSWKTAFKSTYSEHASWGGYMLVCNQ